jgi:hypothetical protein
MAISSLLYSVRRLLKKESPYKYSEAHVRTVMKQVLKEGNTEADRGKLIRRIASRVQRGH